MANEDRVCVHCLCPGGYEGCGFRSCTTRKDGLRAECRSCERLLRSERRRSSQYASLQAEDFDVGVGNDRRIDAHAAEQKRQEYSQAMGEFADDLRESGGDPDIMSEGSGSYIARLAEQERRFGNRRLARSVSLAAAHEALHLRQFKLAAEEYLKEKVVPTGYALKEPKFDRPRTVCLLLSDLHFGSELAKRDSPWPFGAVEEARRFEFVVRGCLDYKPQYRTASRLRVLLNGDVIAGMLDHDKRDGAPLIEQKVAFWRYMSAAIGLFAQQYPSVDIECQPGNHGRDKMRHPGRATSSRWDGHEFEMYYALSQMCSSLSNVRFNIPFQAVSVIDLYGSKLLMNHGDAEIKFGHPDTRAAQNRAIVDRINSTKIYGYSFDVIAVGHFHTPRRQACFPTEMIFNGALIPPGGWERSEGYFGEKQGQWLWESVEGYPVGDARFLEVGPSQDRDEKLGKLIVPFRFGDTEALR